MKEASAFAPGHITGLFQICRDPASALKTGSRGAGISLTRGVITRVTLSPAPLHSRQVYFNQQSTTAAGVTLHALDLFYTTTGIRDTFRIRIEHEIEIPIGCGFGSSGAGALSLLLALNEVMEGPLSFTDVVSLAHRTEVELKTGLGTVMGEAYGGMEIREEAGAPGYGKLSHIPLKKDYQVFCLLYGSLSTSKLLKDAALSARITKAGKSLIDKLILSPSLKNFLSFSRDFARETGLITPRLERILARLDAGGFPASMLMFGDGLFLIIRKAEIPRLEEILTEYLPGATLFRSPIDFKGARIL